MLIKPFTKSTNQRQDNDDFITENALMGVKWGFVAWLLTAISKYDFFSNIDLTIFKQVLIIE